MKSIVVKSLFFFFLVHLIPCYGWPESVDNLNKQAAAFNETLATIKQEITPAAATLNKTVNDLRESIDTNVTKVETQFNPARLVFYGKNVPIMGLGFAGGIFALMQLSKEMLRIIEHFDHQKSWVENLKQLNKKTVAKLVASSLLLTASLLVIGKSENIVNIITCTT